MTEKELIQKIKELKQIKPKQEWVVLCKNQILEEMTEVRPQSFHISSIFSSFRFKPAFATLVCIGFLVGIFGLFGFIQNTLPGDTLYTAKKAAEQTQLNLTSKQEKPKMALELTNKKLQELSVVAEANLGKNLASAIKEVEQASQLAAQEINESLKKNVQAPQEMAHQELADATVVIEQAKEFKENKEIVEQTLAIKMETSELDESINSYYKALVEQEIKALENQTLTSEQEQTLEEVQELFIQEKYDQAFEKLLLSQ